ncbi:hypothetical protein B296_00016520 [Ensete ventricosum]|uniref:Uncharacterized protein n=1 Tax=Ensete ventricosum TaxID=4639 RepID=A0A427A8X9_ENSVE|nr:hypothetical protein B296_00016520 [Ensete ventricosum]
MQAVRPPFAEAVRLPASAGDCCLRWPPRASRFPAQATDHELAALHRRPITGEPPCTNGRPRGGRPAEGLAEPTAMGSADRCAGGWLQATLAAAHAALLPLHRFHGQVAPPQLLRVSQLYAISHRKRPSANLSGSNSCCSFASTILTSKNYYKAPFNLER